MCAPPSSKGLPYQRVIMKHVLRNALIAPFTVIVLQLNWILSGVVVVEVFFQYEGLRQAPARSRAVRRPLCRAGRLLAGCWSPFCPS
jgi:ABC-type microcin C transport system permease subunit YejB